MLAEAEGLGVSFWAAIAGFLAVYWWAILAGVASIVGLSLVIWKWKKNWNAVRRAFKRLRVWRKKRVAAWRESKWWPWRRKRALTLPLFIHVSLFMLIAVALGLLAYDFLNTHIEVSEPNMESATERFKNIVTTTVAFLGLATAGGAAAVGYRRQRSHETTANIARMQTAIEHLGSERPEIRKGAIFELKRLALDSKNDADDVIDILRNFVLENCSEKQKTELSEGEYYKLPSDVRLAFEHMAVITRQRRFEKKIDLSYIVLEQMNLQGMDFSWADLKEANFKGAFLRGANLREVHLQGADLKDAHLEVAHLEGAHLEVADLTKARLEKARLEEAHLVGADLKEAHLNGAYLIRAHLEYADLNSAHLNSTHLEGAHLHYAKVDKRTNFSGAKIDENTNFFNAQYSVINGVSSTTYISNLRQAKGLPDWVLDKFDPIPETPKDTAS
jgi:uncharacterized protein YjbI with pentapeptide repeats